jgi:hypothetical protein
MPKRKPENSYHERLQIMAESGDVVGLLDLLVNSELNMTTCGQKAELLQSAIQHGSGDLHFQVQKALDLILQFNMTLLARAQGLAASKIACYDRTTYLPFNSIPNDVVEQVLPRVAQLQDRVIAVCKTISTIKNATAARQSNAQRKKWRNEVEAERVRVKLGG